MSGLADELKTELSVGIKRITLIEKILKGMTPEDADALRAALNDRTVSGAAIKRVLARRNIHLSESVISNYRNGHYGTF